MLGDLFNFAKFHAKDAWGMIKDNPERMLLGAADPLGTKVWGGVLGKDWDPMVNPFGGATEDQFNRADEAGLNTGPSRALGGIADTIAGIYGGAGAMGGLGNAFRGASAGPQGGFMSQVDTGGPQGGFMSQVDTGGVQGTGGMDIGRLLQMAQQIPGGGQQEQQQQPPVTPIMPQGGGGFMGFSPGQFSQFAGLQHAPGMTELLRQRRGF